MKSGLQVLIAGLGSHGDIHPLMGIGRALRERGHDIRFLINDYYGPLLRRGGFEFDSVGPREDYENVLEHPDTWHPERCVPFLFQRMGLDTMSAVFNAVTKRHIPGRTVVLASVLAIGARIASEAIDVPLATVHPSPATLQFYANSEADDLGWDGHLAGPINHFRALHGLPPVERLMSRWWNSSRLVLGAFPEWFSPRAACWPGCFHATGFPLYDGNDIEPMPVELAEFLNAGPPPIAVAPSTGMWRGGEFLRACIEACVRLDIRGVLLTGRHEHVPEDLPGNVKHFTYAPFSALLPGCTAIVHQGGIGTIALAMAAGIPQLAAPVAHDQPFNVATLMRFGAARILNIRTLDGSIVAESLSKLINNPNHFSRATQLADRIRLSNPFTRAVELIEQVTPATEGALV